MKTLKFFDRNGWCEDPEFPHAEWQHEAVQGETVLGYADWVIACHERDGIAYRMPNGYCVENTPEASAGQVERFTREDWVREVSGLDTRLSYRDWVAHRVVADDPNEAGLFQGTDGLDGFAQQNRAKSPRP